MAASEADQRPCPNCGKLQSADVQTCANCGVPLNHPVMATLSTARGEIDSRDPTFRIMPDSGQAYTVLLVQRLLNLGSERRQDIAIQSEGVAPRHARLMLEGSNYRIYDLTTTKGVLVNGQSIDSHILRDGDIVRLQGGTGKGVTITYSNPVERAMGTRSIGQMTLFDKFPFTIGRNPQSNLRLDTLAVSWNHAQITDQDGRHILTDLKSTNGTFVNDRRLYAPHRLQNDDVIRIDQAQLIYQGKGLMRLAAVQRFQLDALDLGMTYKTRFPARALNTMREASLSIQPQEFVAVIGGSGSSKSTLLRALNTANPATSGRVLVNGDDLYINYDLYHPVIGYVPQMDIVQNNLTVQQALIFSARLRFPNEPLESSEQRVTRVLETLELADFKDRLIGKLSGGQRKRVSIALELMAEPGLLFMDEPSSGLDPGLDKSMMETLRHLADRGHVVVVVTHTTLHIDLCDQLLIMARGSMVYFGPPKEALIYFGVKDYPEIYNRVLQPVNEGDSKVSPDEAARQWADYYRQSPQYVQYVTKRLRAPNAKPGSGSAFSNKRLQRGRRGTFFQQLGVLTERTLALARHDMRTMVALLLVLPLVGIFLGLINFDTANNSRGQMLVKRFEKPTDELAFFDSFPLTELKFSKLPDNTTTISNGLDVRALGTYAPASDAQRLLFMMSLSVTLLGIFVSAYTIVEEKSLFLRERMVNLRIAPYLASKVVVYGGFSMLSCGLLLLTVSFGVRLPDQGLITWGPLETFITLALTTLAGISVGLLLSALNRDVNAVTYAVLAVLFVQILFPGVLFRMDGALEPLSRLTITRWSLEGLGGTADMISRNDESRIVVEMPVINPKTNKPIAGHFTRHPVPAPSALNVTYPATAGDLLIRWGVLIVFSVVLLFIAGLALNRSESF